MKMKIFFTIAMVTLLSSCTKEEVSDNKVKGEPSSLTLKIKGGDHTTASRATASIPDPDSQIGDFIIFVFRDGGDGDIDISPKQYNYATITNNTVSGLGITTQAHEVYVIANTGIGADLSADLLLVESKKELQAIVGNALDASGSATQAPGTMWMSGSNQVVPVSGNTVNATVTLQFVAAKIQMLNVTVDPVVTGLVLNELIIYNAGAASCLVPHDTPPSLMPVDRFTHDGTTPFYLSGTSMNGFGAEVPQHYTDDATYKYTLTADGVGDYIIDEASGQNQKSFYIFENDGIAFEGKPTIFTLKGTNTTDNTDVYYSYFFKDGGMYDGGTIKRGTKYDVNFEIKTMGSNNPIVPVPGTAVDVVINSAKWAVELINKTFQ